VDSKIDFNPKIFHQKFVIRDPGKARAAVLTGSTNFTVTDTHRNLSTSEHNGEGAGRLLGGQSLGGAYGHDDINLERDQFGRKSGEPLELPLGTSVFDHEIATLDVTEVTQSLEEGLVQVGASGPVVRPQVA